MKLTLVQLQDKLKDLGLTQENGKAIGYGAFKNKSSIMKYGKGKLPLKIVIAGKPKENLFGFYVMRDTDAIVMKEAYDMLVKLANGSIEDYEDGNLQWGDAGIPLSYGNLKSY